jgi:hypothetical protein
MEQFPGSDMTVTEEYDLRALTGRLPSARACYWIGQPAVGAAGKDLP